MAEITARKNPLLIAAVACLSGGVLLLAATIFIQPAFAVLKGLGMISIGILLFGGGEILNHPKEQVTEKRSGGGTDIVTHRRRNACALGNLCIIFSLLLFFIGVSSLLYAR